MKELIIFEWKKLWQSRLTILAIILLIIACIFLNFSALFMYQVDPLSDISSIRKTAQSRTLNQEYLDQLVSELNLNSEELDMVTWYELLYDNSHGHANALHFIHFIEEMSDEELNHFLNSEKDFYDAYKATLSLEIQSANYFNWFQYTQQQMERINERIDRLETPFEVGYVQGIQTFLRQYSSLFILVLFVIAFLLSSMFVSDSPQGIDEVSLALKKGRKQNFNARILTGNIMALTVYAIFIGVMLLQHALVYSLQGWSQSIQNLWINTVYNMSVGTGVLIVIASGLFTVLLIANLVMLISIIIKRAKLATFISLAAIGGLIQLTNSNHPLILQLNPIYFATGVFNSRWGFAFYYFIGDMMIPYTVAFIVLGCLYFSIIRVLTIMQYKRYTLH